jgi:hypothetical protein
MNSSYHIGLLGWVKVYICSDVVDFLKSSRTDPTIGLILIAIGVESEYRSVFRSLSGWSLKVESNAVKSEYRFVFRSLSGWSLKLESNALIVAESDMTNLLRLLKLIWQPDLSMLAIGIESEYRSVSRSLSGWGPKGEHNAPIADKSKVADFLGLLKLIWRSDSSMIAIAAGSEVVDLRSHQFD